MKRRNFLKILGIGAAAVSVPVALTSDNSILINPGVSIEQIGRAIAILTNQNPGFVIEHDLMKHMKQLCIN